MAKDQFQFKQFKIAQDRCAMKVGTDALLLGAWVNVIDREHALDIGSGTGILSLMMAQRNRILKVDAVEIVENAAEQAKENAANSEWPDRISVTHSDLNDFEAEPTFDLIVSNPPYFNKGTVSPNEARSTARQEASLGLNSLFQKAAELSQDNALFGLIYPFDQRTALIKAALENGWFVKRTTEVLDSPEKIPVRILAEFTKKTTPPEPASRLIIRNTDINYHENYVALTKEFLTIF